MKYEWRKHEKELYGTKKKPVIIDVPKQKFIMISGKGNPNESEFSEKVGVLYSLAYPIKMKYKKSDKNNNIEYDDYTVFPLEGVWTSKGNPLDKSELEYTIMIKQPDWISEEDFNESLEVVKKKKPSPLLEKVSFETLEDGLCVQMLHVGSFDSEPESFEIMNKFLEESNLKRMNESHREIYLTDANKSAPEKYKTLLRYKVSKT